MRTYRKRSYRRKRSSTLARLARPKKTTAVQALAKQLRGIKLNMRKKSQLLNFQTGTRQAPGGSTGDAIVQPYYCFPLSTFNAWSRIFGTGTNDWEGNSMIWKSFGLDVHVRSFNETEQINFTMFLISMKDNGSYCIPAAGGNLVISDTTEFINSSGAGGDTASGLVMLNKSICNIHYVKRFTLGNNGAALNTSSAQTQYGTDRRFYIRHRVNKKIQNPIGDVFAMPRAYDPSSNYYLLIFSNNLSADAESPRVFLNVVHTVEMSQ